MTIPPPPRLVDHSLFVLFFPQLVAGPIVSYETMAPQLASCGRQRQDAGRMAALGAYIFVFGLFKKIVVADTLAVIADNGYAMADPTCAQAWAASLAYTYQIYFDFCGYSDMAVGLGKMFGFELPINFDSPYKSKSITEFWRRWHITLGRTLAELIYFPLGGSRHGSTRTCAAIMAVFAVSGLWHGASWKFVAWGLLHGALVVIERIAGRTYERIPAMLRRIYTLLAINALWVFFRAEDTASAARMLRAMIDLSSFSAASLAPLTLDGVVDFPAKAGAAYVIVLLSMCSAATAFPKNVIERASTLKMTYRSAAAVSAMLVLSIVHMSRLSTFIYFNF